MNQRKVSARYYFFEELVWEAPSFANLRQKRALSDLRMLASLVWAAEGGSGTCPALRGIGNKPTSFYLTSGERGKAGVISLASNHQNLGGLLHELAHALGPNDKLTHGPAFRKRCLRLYKEYGAWSGEIDFEAER